MKNKKFKLFASLTSLVMVVAVMAVGVWAATSATAQVSGKASFSATGVAGTLTIASENDNVDVQTGTHALGMNATQNTKFGTDVITFTIADKDGDGLITPADIATENEWVVNYTFAISDASAVNATITVALDEFTVPTNNIYVEAVLTTNTATTNGEDVAATAVVTYKLAINGTYVHDGGEINIPTERVQGITATIVAAGAISQ